MSYLTLISRHRRFASILVIELFIICLLSIAIGYQFGRHSSNNLFREVAHTVLRPAWEDAKMTKELPLSEIYTPYEMDLWHRVAIAAGYTEEQFESSDFDIHTK